EHFGEVVGRMPVVASIQLDLTEIGECPGLAALVPGPTAQVEAAPQVVRRLPIAALAQGGKAEIAERSGLTDLVAHGRIDRDSPVEEVDRLLWIALQQ